MAIALTTVYMKHERRVRLLFSVNLAAGAFTSTSYYSVENLDGNGTSPSVVAVMALGSAPNGVELQLGADLVQGAAYRFLAEGVPGVDATTTPDGSYEDATFGRKTATPDAAHGLSELDAIVYGKDLRWAGGDFVEDHKGDLALVAGVVNARDALQRRAMSDGLPWDPDYGLKPREYVDGTPGGMFTIRGRAVEQMLADDRVNACKATVDVDSETSAAVVIIEPELIGARGVSLDPIHVTSSS